MTKNLHLARAALSAALALAACGSPTPSATSAGPDDAGPPDFGPAPNTMSVTLPSCAPNTDTVPARVLPTEPPSVSALRVDGRRIVNASGDDVALRGTNFGAWLQAETWLSATGRAPAGVECATAHATCYHDLLMSDAEAEAARLGLADAFSRARSRTAIDWLAETAPRWPMIQRWRAAMWAQPGTQRQQTIELWQFIDALPWIFEEESLWAYLQTRFGAAGAERLRRTHQDHWITELDVERLAALGLNTIRVPIWYAQLEQETDTGVSYRIDGWQRLDDIARWARLHGVYLILDLHGAPGGQSHYDHQGLRNGGSLWTRPECVSRTASLWNAIATHFRGDPHVAMYDLLNEPKSPNATAYADIHTALYRAIRTADPEHMIAIEEGYAGVDRVRSPSELGFSQTVFELHDYPSWTTADELGSDMERSVDRWLEAGTRFDTPILVGEFNAEASGPDGSPAGMPLRIAAMDAVMARLNARGVHWTTWTWKTGGRADSVWGLYHPADARWIDVSTADLDTVDAAFRATNSATWTPIPAYEAVFRARAADPVTLLR